jgi:hypothetical protein
LCRVYQGSQRQQPGYQQISMVYEAVCASTALVLSILTTKVRFVAPFLNKIAATEKSVSEILAPEINRRKALMKEYGKDYPDKPVRMVCSIRVFPTYLHHVGRMTSSSGC